MTPEAIVRALAAADPLGEGSSYPVECALCRQGTSGPFLGVKDIGALVAHEPDCPWRLAVEWTATQDYREPRDPLTGDPIGKRRP